VQVAAAARRSSAAPPTGVTRADVRARARAPRVFRGVGLTLGLSITYLSLLVLLPLAGLLAKSGERGARAFVDAVTDPRVLASFRLTFGTSLAAAAFDSVFGFATAWVLVRYRFFGRRFVDAAIDLPFALPTAVAGITLATLYAPNGWLGSVLGTFGIKGSYTPLGIVIALSFVSLPFVVRTVQVALLELDRESEEAALLLGARPPQIFRRVIFPAVWPAVMTGFTLAFARALGEYGSVVFIAGNMPMRTEVTTLLVIGKLEQYDYAGAAAIATVMLGASFVLLLVVNVLQRRAARKVARS
jgi:sulfate/thiosulfate transport system permease protein